MCQDSNTRPANQHLVSTKRGTVRQAWLDLENVAKGTRAHAADRSETANPQRFKPTRTLFARNNCIAAVQHIRPNTAHR
eukprot:7577948-Pyramimonas_sp.AAC.1